MMPHSMLHKRVRLWTMYDWRFRPSRKKMQRSLNAEKLKNEKDQDKGLIERLIQKLKEMT